MNRNDFLNMLEDSVPVNRQMIGEVYELIDIFPYFQSAHMLLLKGLQNNADVKFENQLRNSAIHIADREKLYYLLKNRSSVNIVADKGSPEIAVPEIKSFETEQTVIESAKNSEHLISEIEKNSGEAPSNETQDNKDLSPGHSILISPDDDIEVYSGAMMLLDEESSETEEKVFFMDPGFSASERSDLLELDLDENVSDVPDDIELIQDNYKAEESIPDKILQADLIDKFIIANPRIEPNRDKTIQQAEDISKTYVENEGGFVTETLARIYINQGYYSKAIDIYEKLCLKFPEKSSYFASQIEKVKEYIKK